MSNLTRQQAIDKMCKGCIYDEKDRGAGTWKQQVEACTMEDCPLWYYRPLSGGRRCYPKRKAASGNLPSQRKKDEQD